MVTVATTTQVINADKLPVTITVQNETNLTIAKIFCNGKEYEVKVNGSGKAQMV